MFGRKDETAVFIEKKSTEISCFSLFNALKLSLAQAHQSI